MVVSNEDRDAFIQASDAVQNQHYVVDSEIQGLRDMGDSYMVEGMNAVWDKSMKTNLPSDSHDFVDKNGNPLTDVHPEAGSYFNISKDGKTLTVDPDINVSESTSAVGLGGDRPAIHSHPVHGGLYKKSSNGRIMGPAREPEGPSAHSDYPNSAGRERRTGQRYRDVVIGPNNIYLYKRFKDAGKVPRSFFKN